MTNDVHYARPEDREFQDVLTAIRHGRTLDDARRPAPAGRRVVPEVGADELARPAARRRVARPRRRPRLVGGDRPRRRARRRPARSTSASSSTASRASRCPSGETPFSYLSGLCWEGARRRYHPLTSAVVNRLAHELDVIERAGLAEFFLICWDLMRFAKEQGIPAQGRGSATSSIVSYTLGISRVEPIQHNLLFERFINEGRTTYPDVDIDFSSERREEVIQYVYGRYGPEHTGMVCNLVTYRARSAVREVGVALGFPRPLVDRVAKALETYDSGHGPARPRGRRRVRRVLPATGRGRAGRVRGGGRGRGARPGRRDGPAEPRARRAGADRRRASGNGDAAPG